jgi:hypothetical protein
MSRARFVPRPLSPEELLTIARLSTELVEYCAAQAVPAHLLIAGLGQALGMVVATSENQRNQHAAAVHHVTGTCQNVLAGILTGEIEHTRPARSDPWQQPHINSRQ